MSGAPPAVPAAEAPISPVSAVVGTFSRPSETFRRLVARPTWWLPFALILVFAVGSWLVVTPKMDMDRTIRESIEKRAEKSGRTIPPEAVNRQVEMSKKMMPLFFGIAIAGSAVFFFLPALVLWGSAKAMGADARYQQLLAIWGHAGLPNLLGTLVAIPIFLQLPDTSLTQEGVAQVLKSNVGAFLDPSAPAPLLALAGSLDVFSLYALTLLVLGFRRLPGLSKGAATATPIVLWLVYVTGKVVWRAVFG
ncbi:MAG TPA: YIP1 family protein [Thermoanaerobaculia bacterium]|nr:YIP1 family protein [Thermoanaerobaculia bacterium]